MSNPERDERNDMLANLRSDIEELRKEIKELNSKLREDSRLFHGDKGWRQPRNRDRLGGRHEFIHFHPKRRSSFSLNSLGEQIGEVIEAFTETIGETAGSVVEGVMDSIGPILDEFSYGIKAEYRMADRPRRWRFGDSPKPSTTSNEVEEISLSKNEALAVSKLSNKYMTLEELKASTQSIPADELESYLRTLRDNRLIIQESAGRKRFFLTRKGYSSLNRYQNGKNKQQKDQS
ncbi:MAG TPA: hypothetical protein VJ044_14870 [Candidatus Hodarchaeales archaeon]|nr:hypothetical protein [Candidatus Hodarchaeales archaeon]